VSRASGQGDAAVRGATTRRLHRPGRAGLVIVGESKVEDAIQHDVTRAQKQTAKELDMDPEDADKALQETVKARPAPAPGTSRYGRGGEPGVWRGST
jgi:hypothetical protein